MSGIGQNSMVRMLAVVLAAATALVLAPATADAGNRSVVAASPAPDLRVSAYAGGGASVQGTGGATIENRGGAATGVVVDIVVPPGLAIRSATYGWFANPCTVTATAARCTIGRMPADDSRFVSLTTEALAPGDHQITVTAASNEADATPADNMATATVNVPLPDLQATIEVDDDVQVDTSFAAVVIVEHRGVTARNVVVTIDVSAGLVIDSAAIGWFSVPCTTVAGRATCALGTMAGSAKFVALDLRATETGAPTISARVGNGQVDRIPSNDLDVIAFPVGGPGLIDLGSYATVSPRVVGPGRSLIHAVNVTNLSTTTDATGVVVTSTAPAGFTVSSATIGTGSCTVAGADVTCTVDHLRAGYTTVANLTLVAPPAEGSTTLRASVVSSVADPNPLDNQTETTVLVGPPDLRATILEWPTTGVVGTSFPARIDISNRGAEDPNAVLRLEVSPGLAIDSAAIGWLGRPCTISGAIATCAIGRLPSTSQFVLVRLRPTQAGPSTLTAIAGTGGPDLDPSDNTAVATVTAT